MSFRTVFITKRCKLSYKNDYLIVRAEETTMVHLSEINYIIVSSTAVSITAYLINELIKNRIGLLFCDEHQNPVCDIQALHGSHDSSKKIRQQIDWQSATKTYYWQEIVRYKINKQKEVLDYYTYSDSAEILEKYIHQLSGSDISNREGHAAKVYFNCIFGDRFKRDNDDVVNASLNYGYSILLSFFNKEVYCNGYLTELGIMHRSVFNPYNLASDLMEPFRPLVDRIVLENSPDELDTEMKVKLINFQNVEVKYKGSKNTVGNVIKIYVKNTLEQISKNEIRAIDEYEFCEEKNNGG